MSVMRDEKKLEGSRIEALDCLPVSPGRTVGLDWSGIIGRCDWRNQDLCLPEIGNQARAQTLPPVPIPFELLLASNPLHTRPSLSAPFINPLADL